MNPRALAGLLVLRLVTGLSLVLEGYQKLATGWLHGTQLLGYVNGWMTDHKTFGFFLPVAQAAQAHPKVFSVLVTVGELLIGLCLVLGLASRLAGILGTLLYLSIALASGQTLSPPGAAALLAAICFTFVWLPPGRFAGLDQSLAGKLPRFLG